MTKLLPCPFCGKCPEIAVCDNEGNVRGEDYERDPWSGLGYRIVHISEDCPVATDEDGGSNIYDTREEAGRHWNRRVERTCRMVRARWDDGECVWGCRCTACGDRFTYETGTTWRYCPHCGAKVVGEL